MVLGSDAAWEVAWTSLLPGAQFLSVSAALSEAALRGKIEALGAFDHLIWHAPRLSGDCLVDAEARGSGPVLALFRLMKVLIDLGYDRRDLGLTLLTTEAVAVSEAARSDPAHAGVHGLVGSLAKEYPGWRVRLADLPGAVPEVGPVVKQAEAVLSLVANLEGNAAAWRGGGWYQRRQLPLDLPTPAAPLYRSGGVYVVIGGAGGIGEAWSAYMIRRYQAQIVWVGRRMQDAAISERLERLSALGGPAPVYISADAADADALGRVRIQVMERFGAVHGIIHSALVLRDMSLARMDEAAFVAPLSAKVDTTAALARVFAGDALDFVLFFSSIQSFNPFAGQSNYAAGCTFADAAARELDRRWSCPVRIVNWGYWGNVGAVTAPEYRARMARLGIGSIEPPEAMAALEQLLGGPLQQIGFVKLDPARQGQQSGSERLTVYTPETPSMAERLGAYRARPIAV